MMSLAAKVFAISLTWILMLLCVWIWSNDFSRNSAHRSMSVQTGSLHTANRTSKEVIRQVKNGTYDTSHFEKKRLIPPFFRYKEEFQVAPKYRLSSSNRRTISTEVYAKRFCADQNAVLWFDMLQDVMGESRIQYSVVRDPIDRFLSGFVDKCINEVGKEKMRCFGCNGDMSCFVPKLYNVMLVWQYTKSTKYQYELAHFAPQTWYCNFKDHFDDYIIVRYKKGSYGVSQVADELDSIFSRAGVPYDIRKEIHKQLLVGKTQHKTSGTSARSRARKALFDNVRLLTLVTYMYYYDFIVFGFSLPVLM
ncbi:hypothetical protein Aduo_014925 [Ancylostoma duodenale]